MFDITISYFKNSGVNVWIFKDHRNSGKYAPEFKSNRRYHAIRTLAGLCNGRFKWRGSSAPIH